MECAIKTDGLVKRYDDFTLGPLSIDVPAGTVVGLVGSNGAGKTTLIKCLLGLVGPDAGAMELLDTAITRPDDLANSLKARIGVVLDACAFAQESRVADIALLGKAAYGTWNQELFERLTVQFDLERTKQVKELSRGMGMKLSLAFALAHRPDLLILDEATAGLDPLAREDILDMLRAFMEDENHAVFMASHITSDLEKIADRILCIDGGELVFDLPKEAICDEAGIARCRAEQAEDLAASTLFAPGSLRSLQGPYGVDVLVPDRFAFAKAHPAIPVDRATVDEYLALTLKGERL